MEQIKSSGYIFAGLGSPPAEALNLKLRARLMMEIEDAIKASGMTQTEVAAMLGVAQSRISDLKRGKIDRFSLDTLINFAAELGCTIDLKVTPRAA